MSRLTENENVLIKTGVISEFSATVYLRVLRWFEHTRNMDEGILVSLVMNAVGNGR